MGLIGAAVLAAGGVGAWQWAERTDVAVAPGGNGRPPASRVPTVAPESAPTASAPPESVAEQALRDCRARTGAGDDVLAAATVGFEHWAAHVQAQYDADQGRVTQQQMQATFTRTRLAGPADLRRYAAAVRTHRATAGSCAGVPGASAGTATELRRCGERQDAQQPVLAAAAVVMADWAAHQEDMRASRAGHVHDAAEVWVQTYRAAPEALDRYRVAAAGYDAPPC